LLGGGGGGGDGAKFRFVREAHREGWDLRLAVNVDGGPSAHKPAPRASPLLLRRGGHANRTCLSQKGRCGQVLARVDVWEMLQTLL
jgi:hypothetical protein